MPTSNMVPVRAPTERPSRDVVQKNGVRRSSRKSGHVLNVWKTIVTWSSIGKPTSHYHLFRSSDHVLDPNRHMRFNRSDCLRMINTACAHQALALKKVLGCERE